MKPQFAIAIQYYAGDRDRALALAALIVDLERAPRDDVIMLLVNRFDSDPPDAATMFHVVQKMPVQSYTTTTPERGWPDGCNAMAKDTIRKVGELVALMPTWENVSGVLLMEPDCIPIMHGWIDAVRLGWVSALFDNRWLLGAWRNGGGVLGHINGNMVIRPDLYKLIDWGSLPSGLAWDCAISPQVHEHWRDTHLICNRWLETNLSDHQIKTHRDQAAKGFPVLVHGVKDDSVWNYAKKQIT